MAGCVYTIGLNLHLTTSQCFKAIYGRHCIPTNTHTHAHTHTHTHKNTHYRHILVHTYTHNSNNNSRYIASQFHSLVQTFHKCKWERERERERAGERQLLFKRRRHPFFSQLWGWNVSWKYQAMCVCVCYMYNVYCTHTGTPCRHTYSLTYKFASQNCLSFIVTPRRKNGGTIQQKSTYMHYPRCRDDRTTSRIRFKASLATVCKSEFVSFGSERFATSANSPRQLDV